MHGSRTVIGAQRPSKPDHRVGSEGSMRQQSRPVAIRLRLIHCIKLRHCLKGSMKNRKKSGLKIRFNALLFSVDQYIRKVTTMSGCRGCNVPKKSIRHGTNKTTAKVKASAEFGPCILAFLGELNSIDG